MRERKELEKIMHMIGKRDWKWLILELLLDIRELLRNKVKVEGVE